MELESVPNCYGLATSEIELLQRPARPESDEVLEGLADPKLFPARGRKPSEIGAEILRQFSDELSAAVGLNYPPGLFYDGICKGHVPKDPRWRHV
jgi:hypothetical protein